MIRWKGATPSRNEQHRLKREAVIKAAVRAFNKRGFEGTSLDDIAKDLAVTKTALYYYIKSKNDILLECLQSSADIGDAALAAGRKQGHNGREKVALTLRDYISNMGDDLGGLVLILGMRSLPPKEQKVVIAARDKFDHALRAMIAEGIADGSIAPCDPKLAVFAIMGAINWLPHWFSPKGERSAAEIADQFVKLFDDGLRPRGR